MSGAARARLIVTNPNALTSLQDRGRIGAMRYGVSQSGPMDWVRHAQALRLARGAEAALEFGLAGLTVRAEGSLALAVTGPGFRVHHPDGVFDSPLTAPLHNAELSIEAGATGMWGYLAAVGLDPGAHILSSVATNVRTGLGARDLAKGFPVTSVSGPPFDTVRLFDDPVVARTKVAVTEGPQFHLFGEEARATFVSAPYSLTSAVDRMGYRLEGPPLTATTHDIVSDGIVEGAIQVPGNGQPIVLCADRQPTGGYPKIAVVARASQPALVQRRPGDEVRFELIDLAEAHRRRRAVAAALDAAGERANANLDGRLLLGTNLISGVWPDDGTPGV